MRLALHLENQQSVVFSADADLEDVLSRQKHTTLTAWFVANQKFPNALELSYTNFPGKFVWNKTDREWKERVKGMLISNFALKISNMNIYCCCW